VGIATRLPWGLEVARGEEAGRVRTGPAAEHVAGLRPLARNLPRREPAATVGSQATPLLAGWAESAPLTLLAGSDAIALRYNRLSSHQAGAHDMLVATTGEDAKPMARAFYRIARTNPPTHRDFLSNQARQREPRPGSPDELRQVWDGLSVHETEAQSRRQAREFPRLGSYIAEMRIPDQPAGPIRWQRTFSRNPGHYTLWGDPDELLAFVVSIVPVRE